MCVSVCVCVCVSSIPMASRGLKRILWPTLSRGPVHTERCIRYFFCELNQTEPMTYSVAQHATANGRTAALSSAKKVVLVFAVGSACDGRWQGVVEVGEMVATVVGVHGERAARLVCGKQCCMANIKCWHVCT